MNTKPNTIIYSSKNKWENLIEDKGFVDVFLSDVLEDYIQKPFLLEKNI